MGGICALQRDVEVPFGHVGGFIPVVERHRMKCSMPAKGMTLC
jgi:hypothetical protein